MSECIGIEYQENLLNYLYKKRIPHPDDFSIFFSAWYVNLGNRAQEKVPPTIKVARKQFMRALEDHITPRWIARNDDLLRKYQILMSEYDKIKQVRSPGMVSACPSKRSNLQRTNKRSLVADDIPVPPKIQRGSISQLNEAFSARKAVIAKNTNDVQKIPILIGKRLNYAPQDNCFYAGNHESRMPEETDGKVVLGPSKQNFGGSSQVSNAIGKRSGLNFSNNMLFESERAVACSYQTPTIIPCNNISQDHVVPGSELRNCLGTEITIKVEAQVGSNFSESHVKEEIITNEEDSSIRCALVKKTSPKRRIAKEIIDDNESCTFNAETQIKRIPESDTQRNSCGTPLGQDYFSHQQVTVESELRKRLEMEIGRREKAQLEVNLLKTELKVQHDFLSAEISQLKGLICEKNGDLGKNLNLKYELDKKQRELNEKDQLIKFKDSTIQEKNLVIQILESTIGMLNRSLQEANQTNAKVTALEYTIEIQKELLQNYLPQSANVCQSEQQLNSSSYSR